MSRAPYGSLKATIAALRPAQVLYVRPSQMVSAHNAARRLGLRLASVAHQTAEGLMYRMVLAPDSLTGHALCRLPHRHPLTGRWVRSTHTAVLAPE